MTDRRTASTITDTELDQLYRDLDQARTECLAWAEAESADIAAGSYAGRVEELEAQLAALRTVTRGYCPACGRGDATPTVHDWEQQKRRADQAEELLSIAHDTSNKSEAARARAEAAITSLTTALREALDCITFGGGQPMPDDYERWRAVLDQPAPAAATRATHRQEQP
ncbi:hypothetical protein L0F81_00065 [Streptomyces tricolor]|uniref:DksA C4-type domain-containing protein n=1 Tax=Streptomyces tricolor TaxID=68277 RepID=A0ABS9J7Z6_9ACTN|nr:hypothetical protein [Streptomyces tricolor]MCG0061693.1 hypothetical protein [Streptomyces tricolor]